MTTEQTPRQRAIEALEGRRPDGPVPACELAFDLYEQWLDRPITHLLRPDQATPAERARARKQYVRDTVEVYRAMDHFMREVGASPGRSVHGPGLAASRIVADAREKLAALLGAGDASRIVFTLNCTEALNLAIKGSLAPGDHVVTTGVEHNSVMRPLSDAARTHGVTITRAKADADGMTHPEDLRDCIRPETALILMTHASNVTGAIQPIEECGRIARDHGIPFLVDAAQTAGCVPINLAALPVDMMAISGHKSLLGPQGVGALYIREGVHPAPLKHGGTGSASRQEVQPDAMPDRYESGTPNTPGIAGLSAAIDFLARETVPGIHARICDLGRAVLEGLAGIEKVRLFGPRDMASNAGVFSFTVRDQDAAVVAVRLENRYGILTRVGLQCAPSAHRAIGTYPEGTIRASIGCFTTTEETAYFLDSLKEICGER